MLSRTRAILEIASDAVNRAAAANPQDRGFLESAFTNYISAVAYAEIEKRVSDLLDSRFAECGDKKVVFFLGQVYKRGQGRISKSDIADVAAKFGETCKAVFNDSIDDATANHYANIIDCRHKLSHGEPRSETLLTARNGVDAAEAFLEALRVAIRD